MDTRDRLQRDDLERLYRRYGTVVYRRALRLLGDEPSARDVCHDVFVQVLRVSPAWNPPSPLGWLCTTTTNAALNVLRGRRRWTDVLRRRTDPPAAPNSIPIGALLRGIPERLQEIAVYYGLERMSQDEIALVLGISQKTVSNRIQELRVLLEDPALALSWETT